MGVKVARPGGRRRTPCEPLDGRVLLSLSVMVIDDGVTGSLKVAVTSVRGGDPGRARRQAVLSVTVGGVVSLVLVRTRHRPSSSTLA